MKIGRDKWLHFFGGAVIAVGTGSASRLMGACVSIAALIGWLAATLAGWWKERRDAKDPAHVSEDADFWATSMGGALGAGILVLLL